MIKRITIENYMAYGDLVLELAPGVTVITGANNVGKSALVEAVRSIAQNPPTSRSAIRHGAKSARVSLTLDSGEVITWARTEKSAIYDILRPGSEAEIYAKFGRTPPEDVRILLRLDPVETETGPVDIHIGNQRYPIFLLDQSGSQAASFFAASTEAEYLLRMQQALKTRTDHAKSKRKELIGACARIEVQLERLGPLDALGPELSRAEALHAEICSERTRLPLLEEMIRLLLALLFQHGYAERRRCCLETLSPSPAIGDCTPLDRLIGELDRVTAGSIHLRARSRCLNGLEAAPALHRLDGLDTLLARLDGTQMAHIRLKACQVPLMALLAPPLLEETAALAAQSRAMVSTAEALARSGELSAVLAPLTAPPPVEEVRALATDLSGLETLAGSLHHGRRRVAALQPLLSPPAFDDPAPLDRLIEDLRAAQSHVARSRAMCRVSAALELPPEPIGFRGLAELIEATESLAARKDRLAAALGVHAGLRPGPVPEPTEALEILIGEAAGLEARLDEARRLMARQQESIGAKREEIARALSEAGHCPLCGHHMDLMHFLEEAHGQ